MQAIIPRLLFSRPALHVRLVMSVSVSDIEAGIGALVGIVGGAFGIVGCAA